ncbi:hypothetical protein KP509_36G047600 [Ceratopteris richardii]|nr:hypothetical protein KP509_36G047600 [Ceratopteris richardii]
MSKHGSLLKEHGPRNHEGLFGSENAMDRISSRQTVFFQDDKPPEQKVRDAFTIKRICRVMESHVWNSNMEDLLRPFTASTLSPQVVAGVVLSQEKVTMAVEFFRWSSRIVKHTPHVYHALLIRLGEANLFDQMWHLLDEMRGHGYSITGTSISILMKAYGAAGMPYQALEVLQQAYTFNVLLDCHIYTTILGILLKAGLVLEAKLIYSKMVQDDCQFDGSAWSTLIRGFSKHQLIADAEKCWQAMERSGCGPALIHYNALIEGLCQSCHLNKALSILSSLKEKGLKPNAYTFNPILASLCEARRFAEAFGLFQDMRDACRPNQSTFNMLLEGLFLNADIGKALELYDWMEEHDLTDSRSYFLLGMGLRKVKHIDKLISVSNCLHAKHGRVNVWLCNSLLHCLIEDSNIVQAAAYFNKMQNGLTDPDVVSFATMISGYCKAQKIDEARGLLTNMTVEPNLFCYTPLISAFLKAERVGDALSLLQEVLGKGLAPNSVTCDFVLRKLSDAGRIDDCLWLLAYIQIKQLQVRRSTLDSIRVLFTKLVGPEKARDVLEALKNQGCCGKSERKK